MLYELCGQDARERVTKLPRSNIYSASADDVRELFEDYLDGPEACIALAMSARRLGDAARDAIEKSLAALGYGDDACTFATLVPQGAAGDAGAAGAGAAGAGSAAAASGSADAGAAGDAAGAADAGTAGAGGNAAGAGDVRLDAQALFMLVEGLDPLCVICADAAAAEALGGAYRTEFSLDAPARAFGRPAVAFREFATLIATDDGKQRAWKLLKSLPKR